MKNAFSYYMQKSCTKLHKIESRKKYSYLLCTFNKIQKILYGYLWILDLCIRTQCYRFYSSRATFMDESISKMTNWLVDSPQIIYLYSPVIVVTAVVTSHAICEYFLKLFYEIESSNLALVFGRPATLLHFTSSNYFVLVSLLHDGNKPFVSFESFRVSNSVGVKY